MRIDYNLKHNKAKFLFLFILLIVPADYVYSQNKNLDRKLYSLPSDSLNHKFSFNKGDLIGFNLSIANKLSSLDLIDGDIYFNSESYSDYYKNIYGINPLQKDKIDKDLITALEKTFPKEDEAIRVMRKYLGISQEIFAIILALIHLAKYN
ncbi:MAG: hypothetical protein MUF28_11775 [Ignavibacterium sp.]|jgi:hypothetical protein|nr:hypothetical protein [Ignavibacterium sp.]